MIICCCCKHRRGSSKKSKKSSGGSSFFTGSDSRSPGSIQHLEMNNLIKKIGPPSSIHHHYSNTIKVTEVSVNNVHLYEEMGHGAFGKKFYDVIIEIEIFRNQFKMGHEPRKFLKIF